MSKKPSQESSALNIDQVLQGYIQRLLHSMQSRQAMPEYSKIRKYAVISTPRVGSSLLCQRLELTQKMGWPAEWFNAGYINVFCQETGVDQADFSFGQYLTAVLLGTTSETGVFGLNFHVGQYMQWIQRDVDLLSLGFERIYWVERRDKIAQAYSFTKALQTNVWSSQNSPMAESDQVTIDPTDVAAQLHTLCRECDYYERNLKSHVHREFFYEDIAHDQTEGAVRQIMSDFDIVPESVPAPKMRKQSSHEDAQRIAHIKAYLMGAG